MENIAHLTLMDRSGKPRASLCLLERNGLLAYGLAIKSDEDKWKYGKGKDMAKSRAISAYITDDYAISDAIYISRDKADRNLHKLCWRDYRIVSDCFNFSADMWASKCGIITGHTLVQFITYIGRD